MLLTVTRWIITLIAHDLLDRAIGQLFARWQPVSTAA
jgi:hypothetical protein